jgi:hypothetical protein
LVFFGEGLKNLGAAKAVADRAHGRPGTHAEHAAQAEVFWRISGNPGIRETLEIVSGIY